MSREIYLFWDKLNDSPEILDESGEFYFYSEDSVAIAENNEEEGRSWTRAEKMTDVTPLNTWERFDVFDPKINIWVSYGHCRAELIRKIQKQAGIKNWRIV